jgi:hypothetical protein
MPDAIQLCAGSMRLAKVIRFRDDDRADCSYCNARPKSVRRIENAGRDLYYEIPSHRPDGVRDPAKIDWSQVE